MHKVVLKPGREKTLLRRHPWLFSGALQGVKKNIKSGEPVQVISAGGEILATGAYSPHSQISVRIWSFDPDVKIDSHFFTDRINRAVALRHTLLSENVNACRLINAESDEFPGLIVDRYSNYLVCQFLSAGVEYFKREITKALQEILSPAGIYERSDVDSRKKEGLESISGLLAGKEPPEFITIEENGINHLIDIRRGHKTGMYLDQRDNRCVISTLANNKSVLNCFAYTGSFALAAIHGGASHVTNVESSADAINLFINQAELNGIDSNSYENAQGDVFSVLRQYRETGKKFDLVILDPPKFVSSAQQLKKGSRGYKDINWLAFKLLHENGILVTFSCSGHVSPELFQKIVADAAVDAGRSVKIIGFLGHPVDHPVLLSFPEGRYLKGLVCYT